MKPFGEQLREALKERRLEQDALAKRAHLGLRTVTRALSGEADPTLSTLCKLVREFPYRHFSFPDHAYDVYVVAVRKGEEIFHGRKR
jgi:transcriptional regulator with XRE-family HTH domain